MKKLWLVLGITGFLFLSEKGWAQNKGTGIENDSTITDSKTGIQIDTSDDNLPPPINPDTVGTGMGIDT